MKQIKEIETKISKLPPCLIGEVIDFVDFLSFKSTNKAQNSNRLKQSWAGSLKDIRSKYNSIALQKKALEWRIR